MFSRLKSTQLAVLLALLFCVGVVAVVRASEPAESRTRQTISSVHLEPINGPGQLLRSAHTPHSRLLSRVQVYDVARPSLDAHPALHGELVRERCLTPRSVVAQGRAGRSPPSFS